MHLTFNDITLSYNQQVAYDALLDDGERHLYLHGHAGTGKTYVALYAALKAIAQHPEYHRIVIVRSPVSVHDIGYLPGTVKEKLEPFAALYENMIDNLFPHGGGYEMMVREETIVFEPTSFLRGKTFDNSIVIVDECQNLTYHELKTVITRIGEYSRIIFSGDSGQPDLNGKTNNKPFFAILQKMDKFVDVKFGLDDIQRSDIVYDFYVAEDLHNNPKPLSEFTMLRS